MDVSVYLIHVSDDALYQRGFLRNDCACVLTHSHYTQIPDRFIFRVTARVRCAANERGECRRGTLIPGLLDTGWGWGVSCVFLAVVEELKIVPPLGKGREVRARKRGMIWES